MENKIRKLYRSRKDRILAGVCGGLGEYFEIDSVLVRIVFILLTFARGFGILPYIILAVIIPLESGEGLGIGKFSLASATADKEEKIRDFTQKAGLRAQELADELNKEARSIAIEFKQNESWWQERRNIFAIIIIIVGFFSLLNQLFPSYWLKSEILFSLAAILLGFFIIFKNIKK
jgi:phage shock protein C